MAEKKTKKLIKKTKKSDIEFLKEKIDKIEEHIKGHKHDYKTSRQLIVLKTRVKKLGKKKGKNAAKDK